MTNKGKGWWFLGAMTIIIASLAAVYIGGSSKKPKKPVPVVKPPVETEVKEGYDTELFGIVKAVDEIESTITIYDAKAEIDRTLSYTGGTRVLDRYGKERLMSSLLVGELVNAYYYQASYKASKVEVNTEAWEYSSIDHFQFDLSKQQIKVAGHTYRYERDLFVTGMGEELSLIDINARDELMMKGIGDRVYSVIITKGHGYIRLANYEAFMGGTIDVGYGITLPVVEDMLIAAREGTYMVKLKNGELTGTKEVVIERDGEYVLDLGAFHIDEGRTGKAVFMIDPEGALLYINGIETDYSKKVKLNYGDYDVRVEMEGYADFTGILTIEESAPVICVSLSENGVDTSGTSDGAVITPSESDDTGEDDENSDEEDWGADSENDDSQDEPEEEKKNTAGSTLMDKDHMITVAAPEGAKVYWNGAYKGDAPLTFIKEIGSHVITFSRDGYMTRSYSCEIIDDGNDVTLNFPDMVKKEDN